HSVILHLEMTPPRTSHGGVKMSFYEMPLAAQTAAVTAWQSVALSTKLSAITVEATLVLSTQYGVRSDAGCVVPGLPAAGEVVLLTRAAGGVRPARRMVARATAS